MIEITLTDSNFPHQEYLTPFLKSDKIIWKRDGIRRKVNVYTDNFIKKTHVDVPKDGNYNVCILLEPYTNPPWTDIYDYIQTDFEKFDLIITHNLDKLGELIDARPDKFRYSTKCITTSWLSKGMIRLNEKTKGISMPFSYKNFSEGHRIRHVIYDKYKDTGLIDFFGDGVPDFRGEFRDCFIDYKYVIVCENTLQPGFNSEKFNDALLTGCIPIYWGPKVNDTNYKEDSIFYFSPDKKIINFEFEESLNRLEEIVNFIENNDPYYHLLDSVKSNYEYTLSKYQTENNIFDILYELKMVDLNDLNKIILPEPKENKESLSEIAYRHGTDKYWYHNYTDFYESFFKEFKSPRIIEIGTAGHGSTKMFLDFFYNPYVVGMDIINYSGFTHHNLKFVVGDQSKIEDLKKLIDGEDDFNIILDDGGHTMKQQQISFGFLVNYLKSGGYYIIEDLHTSFNQGFIDSDCEFTSYQMLQRIINKQLPFSNYIDLEKQKRILDRIDFIQIYAKNPEDLKDSVTSVIKIK
jgi:hypothetical protein